MNHLTNALMTNQNKRLVLEQAISKRLFFQLFKKNGQSTGKK